VQLRRLLVNASFFEVEDYRRVNITGIASRPEEVRPGFMFVCGNEYQENCLDVIRQAVENGAAAVCVETKEEIPFPEVVLIRTSNCKRFLAVISRNFYGNPTQHMNLIAVTGSHGKTTVLWMVHEILKATARECIVIGSAHQKVGETVYAMNCDTPEPPITNWLLREGIQKRIGWAALECSFSGIQNDYLRYLQFDSIIFTDMYTNGRNHKMDYVYLEARKGLLDNLKTVNSPVIINLDDLYVRQITHPNAITYSIFHPAHVTARDISLDERGSRFIMETDQGNTEIQLSLPGIYHVYNSLGAAAWGLGENIPLDTIRTALENIQTIPGISPTSLHPPKDVTIHGEDIAQLEKVREWYEASLEKGTGKIITILCCQDLEPGMYQEVGQLLDRYNERIVLIPGDRHLHPGTADKLPIEKWIKTPDILYEPDPYKALQDTMENTSPGDQVLILSNRTRY